MEGLFELFCAVDGLCQLLMAILENHLLVKGTIQRRWSRSLCAT
jgi:hypothetical protein